MSTFADRVKFIRAENGLNREEFGEKIGVSRTAIVKLEDGENRPSKRTILIICSVFKVNELWLTEGIGEIYSSSADSLIDELTDEYDLDELDIKIVREYLKLNKEQRKLFKETVRRLFLDDDEQQKKAEDV